MTVDHRDNQPGPRLRRFQFGIRSLFILVFAAAVGFSTMGTEHARWFHVLFGAALALVILGLAHQIVDLCKTFYGRRGLSADQRWGWRFEVFWRLGVAALLVGYYLITILLERKVLSLQQHDCCDYINIGSSLRDAVAALATLIVFAVIPRPTRKRPRWLRSRWITALWIVACACWFGVAVAEWFLICFLVHVAIQGIGCAEPLWLAIEGFGLPSIAAMRAFFWCSLLGAGGVFASLGLIYRLARPHRSRFLRPWVVGGLLLCSLGVAGKCVIWLSTDGIQRCAPIYVQSWDPGSGHIWITVLLLIVTFVTAATRRMVCADDAPNDEPQINWRRPQGYYHERRAVLLIVVVGLIALTMTGFLSGWNWTGLIRPGFRLQEVLYYLRYMLTFPSACLFLALLLVVVQKAVTGWRAAAEPPPVVTPELPRGRFCIVWVALLATTVLAVPAIAAAGFAVWSLPMLRLW